MKRHTYKGYIIDHDDLGRLYIYNTASPRSEDSDRIYITIYGAERLKAVKQIIDNRIETGHDTRSIHQHPTTGEYIIY